MKKNNTIGLNGYERDELEKSSKGEAIELILALIVFIIAVGAPVSIVIITFIRAILG